MSHSLIRQVAQRIINMYETAKPSMPDAKELHGAAVELVDLIEDLPGEDVTAEASTPRLPAGALMAESFTLVGDHEPIGTGPADDDAATAAPPAEGPPEAAQ